MSIIKSFENGWIISHNVFINNIYKSVKDMDSLKSLEYHPALFHINSPYKRDYTNPEKRKFEWDSQSNETINQPESSREFSGEKKIKSDFYSHSNEGKNTQPESTRELSFTTNIDSDSQNEIKTHTSDLSLKKKKKKLIITCEEVSAVKETFLKVLNEAKILGIFVKPPQIINDNNLEARNISRHFYEYWATLSSEDNSADQGISLVPALINLKGANLTEQAMINKIGDEYYVFPSNTTFFSYDLRRLQDFVSTFETPFDLILLDPPWWNKCIRRRKHLKNNSSYKMMFNQELIELPISKIVDSGSLVAVWCTNSPQNFEYLRDIIFPAWGVRYLSKWYWMKVALTGEPVCPFAQPPSKQPYEQLVFGLVEGDDLGKDLLYWREFRGKPLPEDGKMLISVPSAIHSHKPPLSDVLSEYLPVQPECLELFARYLLPNWTSWGDEVLKLQHRSLFTEINTKSVKDNNKVNEELSSSKIY